MKKTVLIFLLVFFGFSAVAEAKILTFKLVNEFGVPQPIEVRQDLRDEWGVVGAAHRGFGQITFPVDLEAGDKVLITRKYSNSGSAPEGLGVGYQVTANSPSTITKTVNSIQTNYRAQQIKSSDRAILGVINDIRQENNLTRISRIQALDELASLWAQQIEGANGNFVQNENLMWNFSVDGFVSYVNYTWNLNKKLILNRFLNQSCPSYSGPQIPCKDVYLDTELEHLALASVGDVTWIFSFSSCDGVGCVSLEDSGDSSLLDNPICQGACQCSTCQIKQNPLLKIKKVVKKKSLLKVLVNSDKKVFGKIKMVIKQKNRSVAMKGKRTKFGFVFKTKRSSKFNPKKKFKAKIIFYGNAKWQPATIKFK
jgi:hypothetical protein